MDGPRACIACNREHGFERRPLTDGTDTLRCADCGLVWRDPMLSDEERRDRYHGSDYFSKPERQGEGEGLYGYEDYLRDRYLFMWLFTERMDEIERRCKPGRLLDVGCAIGTLLDVARLRGWEVRGVDLSEYAARVARDYYNLDVTQGEFVDLELEAASFDVVTMDDVIEHVADPRRELAEAARVLKPGGLLALSTPNPASWTARLMGAQWFHYKQEEHLWFFTPDAIRRTLDAHGFDVLEIGMSPRAIDLRYLFKRFAYYDSWFGRLLRRWSQNPISSRLGFFVYTGEMRLCARKRAQE